MGLDSFIIERHDGKKKVDKTIGYWRKWHWLLDYTTLQLSEYEEYEDYEDGLEYSGNYYIDVDIATQILEEAIIECTNALIDDDATDYLNKTYQSDIDTLKKAIDYMKTHPESSFILDHHY